MAALTSTPPPCAGASARCRAGSPSSMRRAAARCRTRSATRSRAACARRARTWARSTRRAAASARSSPRPRPRPRAFLGCEPHEVIFGPNMTSLNFMLSRTAGRGFEPGDEILVSSLDHDGGVAPWLELAHDKDLRVQHIELRARHDARLRRPRVEADASARASSRSPGRRTRSARSSTRRASRELAHSRRRARAGSTRVHYAAHEPIDVQAIDADVLLCSPYKFCGPHLGMAYGRADAARVAGAPTRRARRRSTPLGRRFETGTLPYELLAGFNATIDYLDEIGGMEAIVPYERALGERFLATLPGVGRRSTGCRRSRAACRRS